MAGVTRRVYQRLIASEDFQVLVRHKEECDCGSGEQRSKCCHGTSEGPIFQSFDHSEHGERCPYCICLSCITILAKVSNHLELLKPDPADPADKYERDKAISALAFAEDAPLMGGADRMVGRCRLTLSDPR